MRQSRFGERSAAALLSAARENFDAKPGGNVGEDGLAHGWSPEKALVVAAVQREVNRFLRPRLLTRHAFAVVVSDVVDRFLGKYRGRLGDPPVLTKNMQKELVEMISVRCE